MYTDTVSDIEEIVQHLYRKKIPFFHNADPLVIEKMLQNVRILYYSLLTSPTLSDPTKMRLRLRLDARDMWIGDLRVGVPFRAIGLGRQMVSAAEEIACATGMTTVNVFPLRTAWRFWLKMGYAPHQHMVRVLSKSLSPDGHSLVTKPEGADQFYAPQ